MENEKTIIRILEWIDTGEANKSGDFYWWTDEGIDRRNRIINDLKEEKYIINNPSGEEDKYLLTTKGKQRLLNYKWKSEDKEEQLIKQVDKNSLEIELIELSIKDLKNKPFIRRWDIIIGATIAIVAASLGAWLGGLWSKDRQGQKQSIQLNIEPSKIGIDTTSSFK